MEIKTKLTLLLVGSASLLTAALIVVGCASTKPASQPVRTGSNIAEYRQVAITAQQAMKRAMDSLEAVAAQSGRCSPEVLTNFESEIRKLQVESTQMRARSQAIQSRGEAYFEHWHQRLAQIQDKEVRALVEKNRSLLLDSFGQIKVLSRQSHLAFQPFLAELRKLRNELEKDPASLSSEADQNLIKSAKADGERVQKCMAGIQRELESMQSMITPKSNGKAA